MKILVGLTLSYDSIYFESEPDGDWLTDREGNLYTLRMIHYTAWIARRWIDPAFPRAFPWFAENKYWEEHVLALREQAAVLSEPPLEVV